MAGYTFANTLVTAGSNIFLPVATPVARGMVEKRIACHLLDLTRGYTIPVDNLSKLGRLENIVRLKVCERTVLKSILTQYRYKMNMA